MALSGQSSWQHVAAYALAVLVGRRPVLSAVMPVDGFRAHRADAYAGAAPGAFCRNYIRLREKQAFREAKHTARFKRLQCAPVYFKTGIFKFRYRVSVVFNIILEAGAQTYIHARLL